MAKLKKKGFAGPATAGEQADYNRGNTPQKLSPVPQGYTAGKFHAPAQGDPQDDPNYHAKPPTPEPRKPVASSAPKPAAPVAPKPAMTMGPRVAMKGGETALPGADAKRAARGTLARHAFRNQLKRVGSNKLKPGAPTSARGAGGGWVNVSAKSLKVMSLDDYHAMVKAERDAEPEPVGKTKKFPRKLNPAKLMRPVSDEEKIAEVRAGKRTDKALSTGYGKMSGGGALKAPNREPRGRRGEAGRPTDLALAMSVMPAPTGSAKPPKIYLPGVHNPKSPVRPKTGLKRPKAATKSARPTTVSKESPRALDGGGATDLSASIRNVVHKSEGAATMAKTNFSDLFKSELGTPNDEVLCDCPHCDAPITKSDLSKAGKGKKTEISGAKHGKSGAHVRDQNPEGGVMRGGDGRGQVKSSRGVPGAQKTDAVAGVQNGKGSKTRKSEVEDDTDDQDETADQPVVKSQKPQMTVQGSEWVQYITYEGPGSDAEIAKSIAAGMVGEQPTQPMDLNNDLSRLLV